MAKVSVIVPNYNHAQYLKQRIDSILKQTYQDFELILLDDCSTDDSKEILEAYRSNPHVSHLIYNTTNSGSPFAQWNKGIELATGEWIWIAESDDWAEVDFLSNMIEESRKHSDCGLIYSKARYIHNNLEMWNMPETGNITTYSGNDFINKKLIYANVIYNVSMTIFRKDIFQVINQSLYNQMRLCGDWFFYAQLCSHTNVLEIDKICSNYRVHNTNTSRSAECNGLSFIEGIKILNYILVHFKINNKAYIHSWGRFWYKYSIKYQFTKEVNNVIKGLFWEQHKQIVLWYYLYKLKALIWQK